MKTGLIQWCFDLYHSWHARTLQYCKRYCDYLIVALNTNELIPTYKDSVPSQEYKNKKEVLDSVKYVDKVIPSTEFSPMDMLKDNNVDVYICWDERVESHPEEIKYIEEKWWKIIISPRWKWCKSTTAIKETLLQEHIRKKWSE